jgi:DNA-binding CsgD family transcriptional regulator
MPGGKASRVTTALVEGAYESAFEPHPFASLLPRLAVAIGADTAHLALWSPELDSGELAVSHEMPDHLIRCYRDHFWKTDNWRIAVEKSVPIGRAVAGHTIVPYRDLLASEMYNDALKAYGLFDTCCGRLFAHGRSGAAISLLRGPGRPFYGRHEVARLSAVLPHMAQAFALRIRFDGMAGQHQAFDAMIDGLTGGALMLDAKGRIVHATAKARALLAALEPPLYVAAGGRLRSRDPVLDRRLESVFAASESRLLGPVILDLPAGARLGVTPSALARPLNALTGVAFLAVVETRNGAPRTAAGRVAREFRLTPAEARLLDRIVAGDSVAHAAEALEISVNTARFQLKQILHKTGMHRQIDLLRLCLGMSVSRGA